MINYSKLFPTLFSGNADATMTNAKALYDKVLNLSSSALQNAPAIIKTRAGLLTCKSNTESARVAGGLFSSLDVLLSDGEEFITDEIPSAYDEVIRILPDTYTPQCYTDEQSAGEFVSTVLAIADGANGYFDTTLGDGLPLIINTRTDPSTGIWSMHMCREFDSIDYFLMAIKRPDAPLLLMTRNDFDLNPLIEQCDLTAATNEGINAIISAVASKGSMSLLALQSIIDSYGATPGLVSIKEILSGSDEVSIQSVLAAISNTINANTGTDNGDGTFSPYEVPGFCDDVFALAWDLGVSVMSSVIPLLFSVIGAVAGILLSVLSSVVQLIRQYLVKTTASVRRITISPTFNYPLSPFVTINLQAQVQDVLGEILHDNSTTFIPITTFDPSVDGHGVVGYIAISAAEPLTQRTYNGKRLWEITKIKCQVLCGVMREYLSPNFDNAMNPIGTPAICSYPTITWSDGALGHKIGELSVRGAFDPYREDTGLTDPDYDYLQFDDGDFRHSALFCAASILNALCPRETIWHYLTSGTYFDVNALHFDPLNEPAGSAPTFTLPIQDNTLRTVGLLCNHWEEVSPVSDLNPGMRDPRPIAKLMAALMARSVHDHNYTAGWSWEQLVGAVFSPLAHNDYFWESLLYAWFNSEAYNYCWYKTGLSPIPCMDVLEPAVDFANVSTSALLTAGIALATAAIVGAAVGGAIKVSRKRKATARLATSEAKFEEAKDAYLADPSEANRNALAKANRKLTRAWKKAGRAGVTMYNGFDTSTGSTYATGISDRLNAMSYQSDSTELIMHLIRGY